MEFFDSHAHYDDEKFDSDRHEIIETIYNSDVTKFMSAGYNLKSSKNGIKLADKYEYIEDRRLHIGNSQPTNSEVNDLWLDTDETGVALQPELPKFSGLVKQTLGNNGVSTFSAAVANEDFQPPLN